MEMVWNQARLKTGIGIRYIGVTWESDMETKYGWYGESDESGIRWEWNGN